MPQIVLLCEFDGDDLDEIKSRLEAARGAVSKTAFTANISVDPEEQSRFWQVRRSAALVAESVHGNKKALPFIEDAVVPPDKFPDYVSKLYEIMQREQLDFSVWGHAGQGNIHIQPFLDIADPNDRERLFRLSEEVYDIVASLGGVLSGEHNDGLMRTPYLSKIYPLELMKVFGEVKKIFDPLNIFNPGKKTDISLEYLKGHMRDEYDVGPPPKPAQPAAT
jgi:FAD/FMN-containing dehydrogenase